MLYVKQQTAVKCTPILYIFHRLHFKRKKLTGDKVKSSCRMYVVTLKLHILWEVVLCSAAEAYCYKRWENWSKINVALPVLHRRDTPNNNNPRRYDCKQCRDSIINYCSVFTDKTQVEQILWHVYKKGL